MTDTLGPYELRGELGRGAMAIVWRAFDTRLEREVAVKEPMLPAGIDEATASEMGARFVREGKAAAGLNHPGIVTIYAADVYEGRPAIVMELIEGETLSDTLSRGALPPGAALAITDQLLDAAGYAHARGVVHRDIKPDNVFVTNDGRVKLADFGIAHVGTTAALTQAGTVMGTPGYMAPEQVTGQATDARADLFAIGVLAHEMLSGSNPFGTTDGVAPTTVMYRIVHEPLPSLPPVVLQGLPPHLTAVLATATAKDPAARFPDAQAFRASLSGAPIVTGGVAGTAFAPAAGPAPTPSGRPTWLPYAIVGGIGFLVVAGLLVGATSGGGLGGRGVGGSGSATATGSQTGGTAAVPKAAPSPRDLYPRVSASSRHKPDGPNSYGEANVLDGDPNTAWQEGAARYGVGEWLRFDFPEETALTEIRVIPGYLKNPDWNRWWANGRIQTAELQFSDGSTERFTFTDAEGWQTIPLASPRKTTSVKFTIVSVYKARSVAGNGPWDDTSVSEVAFTGWPASEE